MPDSRPQLMLSPAARAAQKKNRRTMFLILVICLLPPIIAAALFYGRPSWLDLGSTNHGQLIQPARTLPALGIADSEGKPVGAGAFRKHWTLIYIGGADCDAQCVLAVHKIRSIRSLLQAQYKRLHIVYLAPDAAALARVSAALLALQPPPRLMADDAAPGAQAMEFFDRPAGSVVLIDPLAQWVLAYPPGTVTKDIYRDVRHLLRYSRIG